MSQKTELDVESAKKSIREQSKYPEENCFMKRGKTVCGAGVLLVILTLTVWLTLETPPKEVQNLDKCLCESKKLDVLEDILETVKKNIKNIKKNKNNIEGNGII